MYTDPSGHTVACDAEIGLGCQGTGFGDLSPSEILKSDQGSNNPDLAERAIYNYSLTHPEYNYVQDSDLDDTGKYLVVNAMFRGEVDYASRQSSFRDRVSASWRTFAFAGGLAIFGIIVGGSDTNGDQRPDGQTCRDCGTYRPDLARSGGRLRIDDDGASLYCRTCLKKGNTRYDPNDGYFIHSFDEYEKQARTVGVPGPTYTGENNPGHFSAFEGAVGEAWEYLNSWIRSKGKSKP